MCMQVVVSTGLAVITNTKVASEKLRFVQNVAYGRNAFRVRYAHGTQISYIHLGSVRGRNIIIVQIKILDLPPEQSSLALPTNAASSRIVAALNPANSNDLAHLAPEADGRTVESILVSVDAGTLPDQVGLVWLDELCALDELPSGEGDEGCDGDR